MLHGPSLSGCGRVRVSACFDHPGGKYIENKQWCTSVTILRSTVVYVKTTIHSETQNTGPAIGTDWSHQTWQNPLVDGYGSVFYPARGSRSGFWICLAPNRPVFAVQIRTAGRIRGLITNTWHMHHDWKSITRRRTMYIHISRQHTFDLGCKSSLTITRWHRLRSVQIGHQFQCQQTDSLWSRYTRACAPPECQDVLCCAILPKKEAVHLIFPKHGRVSFHCTFHILNPQEVYSPLLLFSDFGPRFLDQSLNFYHCGAQKLSCGHFGHIQGKVHVRLFQQYPTSLPCHSCRHVEALQELSCCIYISDSAITSTIYTSIASSKVVTACSFHYRGCLWLNSYSKLPKFTSSRCLISRTVWTNAFVDHGGLHLWVAVNWSHSSLCTPAVCVIVRCRPSTSIRQYSHPIVFCFWLLPLLVPLTIFNYAAKVIISVAAFAPSRYTQRGLRCSRVQACAILHEAPVVLLNSNSLSPCWGVCGAMIYWCGSEERMITKRCGTSWGWW